MKKHFTFSIDNEKKTLYFQALGFWNLDIANDFYDGFVKCSAPLISSDWNVVADVSEFCSQRKDVQEVCLKVMQYGKENGMIKSANIISRPINRIELEVLLEKTGVSEYEFFNSKDDALAWL